MIIESAYRFHREKDDLFKFSFDEDRFLDAIMRVLLNHDIPLQNAVKALENDDQKYNSQVINNRAIDPDEYFASGFIAWASEHRKDLFRWLAELSGTALVAEALIEIRTPQPNQLFKPDVVVYLDTPFLMELIGCSGHAARDDAKFIVDILKAQRISVGVLAHSVDELRGNLRAVLSAHPSLRTGPTAKALLFREVNEQYLEAVLNDSEHFIDHHGIQMVDPAKLPHLIDYQVFTRENEQSFYAAVQHLRS